MHWHFVPTACGVIFLWLLWQPQRQEQQGGRSRRVGTGHWEVEGAPLCGVLAGVQTGRGPQTSYCTENSLNPQPESSSHDWRTWTDYFLKKLVINQGLQELRTSAKKKCLHKARHPVSIERAVVDWTTICRWQVHALPSPQRLMCCQGLGFASAPDSGTKSELGHMLSPLPMLTNHGPTLN